MFGDGTRRSRASVRRRRRTKVTRVSWTTGRVSTRPEVVERTAGSACACDRVLRESSGQPPPPPKTTDGRLTAGTRSLENIYRILSSHNGGRDGGCGNRRWAHHRGCWVEPARAAGGGTRGRTSRSTWETSICRYVWKTGDKHEQTLNAPNAFRIVHRGSIDERGGRDTHKTCRLYGAPSTRLALAITDHDRDTHK